MPKINWNWNLVVGYNPNITVKELELLMQLRPADERISILNDYASNPNITYEFICANYLDTSAHIAKFAHNEFLWNDTVYKREIARDTATRRRNINETLQSCVGANFNCVARYIDYA